MFIHFFRMLYSSGTCWLLVILIFSATTCYSQSPDGGSGMSRPVAAGLVYLGRDNIHSSKWIKSLLFNSSGTKLYTLNLENMSIDEFDRQERKLLRTFSFLANPAEGWDYHRNRVMNSFEEKPVEACFSRNDKILWVSLHNAGGIVGIRMDTVTCLSAESKYLTKRIRVFDSFTQRADSMSVPFIKTGKTPKVINRTSNGNYLMVSNWHSGSVSFLSANDSIPPYARLIKNVEVGPLPRGLSVNSGSDKTIVAIMGGSSLVVIDDKTRKIKKVIPVMHNPRHIAADQYGRLFVSFNSLSQIACIDPLSGRTLFKTVTAQQPRTICLSKDQRYLFVTCYGSNKLQVFKINKNSFSLLYSLDCPGKPVGLDLYEGTNVLEAWVCTYTEDNLKIFTFRRN